MRSAPALAALGALVVAASAAPVHGARQTPVAPVGGAPHINLSFADARPVIDTLREALLPQELRGKPAAERERVWAAWVTRHDREIRARLDRGDEDSIVNLLLFGTTFTALP